MIRTLLFDLDGTLLDTAPDLAYALNQVRRRHDLPPLSYAEIRPVVSHGATALVRRGFDLGDEDPRLEPLRQELLDVYVANLTRETDLFPGMAEVLEHIEARGLNWGVVTNKPAFLTDPLLEQLGLAARCACIISGDTTAERKPHPEPLLHACRVSGSTPEACLYVGDAQRDIEAGQRAGMPTLVALFGYIDAHDRPETWGADGLVETPGGILDWLNSPMQQRAP